MDVRLIYSEERGTYNVFVNGEWYFEGNYEDALRVYQSFLFDDKEYEEDYDYEES